jgi:hypothetical protein
MLLPAAEVERTVIDTAYMSVVARMFRREVVASRLTELIKVICRFRFSGVGTMIPSEPHVLMPQRD